MTFTQRIEDLVGVVDDVTGLDQHCSDEAEIMLRQLPDAVVLTKASRYYHTGSAGWPVIGKRVIKVNRGGYACRKIEGGDYARFTTSGHLEEGHQQTPVFYIRVTATDSRLFVYPAPANPSYGDVWYVAYPSIDADTDTSKANLPEGTEELVAVGAARRVLQRRKADAEGENDVEIAAEITQQIATLNQLYDKKLETFMVQQQ